MDVHGQSTTLVVLGPSGRKLKEQVLETRGAVLRDALRALARPRYLCMEEGMFSQWLYEELYDTVDELRLVPRRSKREATSPRPAFSSPCESNRADSESSLRCDHDHGRFLPPPPP
jgi:hypothetical protein